MTCQGPLMADEPEDDADVLDRLREIIGVEAYGRLLEARKVLAMGGGDVGVVDVLRRAADIFATLLVQERAGWAVQLARRTETRPVTLA